jgi:hypothetical protein
MKSIQSQVTSETGRKAERVRNGAGRDILGEVNLPESVIGPCQHVDIGDFTMRGTASVICLDVKCSLIGRFLASGQSYALQPLQVVPRRGQRCLKRSFLLRFFGPD